MRDKKIIIFPGAHKTATSLLQATMENLRPRLEDTGLSIAKRQTYYKSGMRNLFLSADLQDSISENEWLAMAETVLGADWASKDIVISIENMFGEAYPSPYPSAATCIKALQRFFPEHKIDMTFYVRRQDSFFESLYIQSVHRGSVEDAEAFSKAFKKLTIDWLKVLQPAMDLIGPENVTVLPFETIKFGPRKYVLNFFRKFTDIDRKEILNAYERVEESNMSLSDLGIRVAQAGFSELETPKERRLLTKTLQREFGADKFPRYRIPPEIRDRIVSANTKANTRLVASGLIPAELKATYLFK